MVKRSYSRLAYAAPMALLLILTSAGIALILPLARAGWAGTQVVVTIAETFVAALTILTWLDRWRTSARNNRRRQAAARGEGTTIPLSGALLGDDHPPLPLPVTIRLTMAWRDWLIAMGGALLILECIVVATALLAYRPEPGQYPTAAVLLLCEAGLLAFLALITAIIALTARETLVVAPDGLRGRRHGLPQFVRWEDARLFARLDDLHFELASPTAIVRFTRLDQVRGQRPTIPFEDYRRQTDALLLHIAERTGLPLADLRTPAASPPAPRSRPTLGNS